MAEFRRTGISSLAYSRKRKSRSLLIWTIAVLLETTRHGVYAGHHHNNKGLEKLLAAGLIAKALAKGGEEGGGGGHGHHYIPIHVPMHHQHHQHHHAAASNRHHHHVHHKYVPIPVKHHTNFIIAHHKVKVPVHVPIPVVKTKVVHVPVEKTKIVPIIVNKPHHHHHDHPHHDHDHPHDHGPHYGHSHMSHSDSILRPKKYKHIISQPQLALATNSRGKQLRITSLGKVKQVKHPSSNATTLQFHRSPKPEKWIVVVKTKKRSSIRRNGSTVEEDNETTLKPNTESKS